MKKLFSLIVFLILSSVAVAGPEDHTHGATYTTSSPAPYYLTSFSFDSAMLVNNDTQVMIEAKYGNLSGLFPITNISRHNEERIFFTAKKTIINKWQTGCEEAEVATIIIKGEDNIITGIDIKNLHITVEYSIMNDTCHPSEQKINFEYKLEP